MRSSRKMSLGALLTVLAVAGLLASYVAFAPSYPRQAYISGWLLFALMLILTFYNIRKRVPFLSIGSSNLWLRLHICLGIFSGFLFFVHIGWSWPFGVFRQVLASCYAVVFLSGLVGWWMSRAFPKRLTVAGYETPYERIPQVRANLRGEAEALVLAGVDGQTSPIIAEFYTEKLGAFFRSPCNLWAHVFMSRYPQAAHAARFDEVERYVKKGEREMLDKLRDLVDQKHLLDYQYSLQRALRLWLFVHIPLSYSLLVFSVLHIILVHSFSGSTS
jgi:hypothetical protein